MNPTDKYVDVKLESFSKEQDAENYMMMLDNGFYKTEGDNVWTVYENRYEIISEVK